MTTTRKRYYTLDVESVLKSAQYFGVDIDITPTLAGLEYVMSIDGAPGHVFMQDTGEEEPVVESVDYFTGETKTIYGSYSLENAFMDLLPLIAAPDLVGRTDIDAIRFRSGTRWILFDHAEFDNKGDVLVHTRMGNITYVAKNLYVLCK